MFTWYLAWQKKFRLPRFMGQVSSASLARWELSKIKMPRCINLSSGSRKWTYSGSQEQTLPLDFQGWEKTWILPKIRHWKYLYSSRWRIVKCIYPGQPRELQTQSHWWRLLSIWGLQLERSLFCSQGTGQVQIRVWNFRCKLNSIRTLEKERGVLHIC